MIQEKKKKKKSATEEVTSTQSDMPSDPKQTAFAELLDPSVKEVFYSLHDRFTPVQLEAGTALLTHKDVVVESPTGSGKTLAFGLPLLSIMHKRTEKWKQNEIGALILSPTRELAIQIAKVLEPFGKALGYSVKTSIGGTKKDEKDLEMLIKEGCNILVATPGRLSKLLTLDKDQFLKRMFKTLEVLIVDEADRFTEAAFSTSMNDIMAAIPKLRRTGLFSATQVKEQEDLIKFTLRSSVTIKLKERADIVCPTALKNYYTLCDANLKLITLLEFIRSKPDKKILVFLSSWECVVYFNSIFPRLLKKRKILAVHGQQQSGRTTGIEVFQKTPNSVMLCTDVLSRGIDIEDIDWVVQFDVPRTSSWFVHRAGRTSRNGREGAALLLLTPQESAFIKFVEKYEMVKLEELKVTTVTTLKAEQLLEQIRRLAMGDRDILLSGTKAFVSFVEAYKRHDSDIVCALKDLDLMGLAHAYGLLRLPRMEEISARSDQDQFKRSDYDTSKIPFLTKDKEKKRVEIQEKKMGVKKQRKQAALEKKEKKAKKEATKKLKNISEANATQKETKDEHKTSKKRPAESEAFDGVTPKKKQAKTAKAKDNNENDHFLMRKMKGGRLGKKDLKALD
ncbi:unnamed protein product, partial [Mesorhabditis belari]|uniref:ATP-dependent RNA helicase n=1 Tax=Mesorhabditis belari TaxID=2138241 RepID=A0AAF3E8S4_9BILA